MLRKIARSAYLAFVSIVLISIIFASWTVYIYVSQSSKSSEIILLVKDMYQSQKSFATDFLDLTQILIENTPQNIPKEEELVNKEIDNSQLDDPSLQGDNGDNPLGIIIEPSEDTDNLDNPFGIIIEPSEDRDNLDNQEIKKSLNTNKLENTSSLDERKLSRELEFN